MATVNIIYEGKNITADIAPFLTAFTFTDNSENNADDLSITLQDRNSVWLNEWMPSKGDTISASISSGRYVMHCGSFEIDEISYSFPPRTITLKAVSCAVSKQSALENHNRTWYDTTLQAIAQDIATSGGLSLFYDAQDYPLEQREQFHSPDLPFLQQLCSSFGLSVKISTGKIIIFNENDYDSHDSADTITPDSSRLLSASFTSKSAKIFRKSHVKFHHPIKNETYEAEYEDSDEEGSERELEIFERVDSQEQAQQVARQSLIRNNSKEITATLSLIGNSLYLAGLNISLDGFGMFTGKYFIDKVTHSVGPGGWTASLSLKMGGQSKKSVNNKKAHTRRKSTVTGGIELADDSRGY